MNIMLVYLLDVPHNMSPSINAVTAKAALILWADDTDKSCTHYFLRHLCIVPARSSTSGEQNCSVTGHQLVLTERIRESYFSHDDSRQEVLR